MSADSQTDQSETRRSLFRTPAPGETADGSPDSSTSSLTTAPNPAPAPTASRTQSELFEAMQKQIRQLTEQVTLMKSGALSPSSATSEPFLSREYWARPIANTIYPGEDAKFSSKRAYKQRLDAYIRKSAPIWSVATKNDPCPILADAGAMASLKTALGPTWAFDHSDISGSMSLLSQHDLPAHDRVQAAMEAGGDSPNGSWKQRNSALYSTVCDTLDLSKNGSDLDVLDVVEDGNGVALYHLIQSRLKQVQTSDPMARAIKMKMGIDHITYVPRPHGVPTYFAKIKDHRQALANLPKPKHIEDWEVVAKALQDLPPLHSKFEGARRLLEIQRMMMEKETSLAECVKAFTAAEADNLIYQDLRNNNKNQNRKRKIKANIARQQDKRPRSDPDRKNPNAGKFDKGSCIHHPRSTTHCTEQCTNPFGSSSIFAMAVDRVNKCAAIKKSLAAGWSPKATNVQVPEGYGTPQLPAPGAKQDDASQTLGANISNLSPQKPAASASASRPQPPSPDDINAYHRVRSMLLYDQRAPHPYPHPWHQPWHGGCFPTPRPAYYRGVTPRVPPPATAAAVGPPQQQLVPTQPTIPLRAHMANLQPPLTQQQQVAEADLIAAGMHYFQRQAGNQDFRFG